MATEIRVLDLSIPAAADQSTKQFYAAAVNSAGRLALCSAAGQLAIGLIQSGADTLDRASTVRVLGVSKGFAGDVIAAGAAVATDANGKLKTASALVQATGAASNVIGIALKAAAADGDIIPVFLIRGIVPTSAA